MTGAERHFRFDCLTTAVLAVAVLAAIVAGVVVVL